MGQKKLNFEFEFLRDKIVKIRNGPKTSLMGPGEADWLKKMKCCVKIHEFIFWSIFRALKVLSMEKSEQDLDLD